MPIVEQISAFFADMGVAASVVAKDGALKTGTVLLDAPDVQAFGDMAMGRSCTIQYPTNVFSFLAYGDVITVGQTAYRVETVRQIDDGVLSEAMVTPLDDDA